MDGLVECLRCGAPIPGGALQCAKCPQQRPDQSPAGGIAALKLPARLEWARQHLVWALGHPNRVGADGFRRAQELYDLIAAEARAYERRG